VIFYGTAFGFTLCTLKTKRAMISMKPKIHEHNTGIRNTVGKTPLRNQQEKRDRLGALIVFGLFFGTLIYVLIEQIFN